MTNPEQLPMSETNGPQDDLAYLKRLVAEPHGRPLQAAAALLWGGGLYGAQCFVQWLQAIGWLRLSPLAGLAVGLGPTVVFLIVLTILVKRDGAAFPKGGAAARAANGAFAAIGLTNLAMIMVFGFNAWRRADFLIWELYPAVVFALQGAAWITVYTVRRQGWALVVGLGWLVSSVLLGLLIGTSTYVLVAAIALILLMAVPGLVILRRAG
jgi:hypothetical protein